MTTTAPTTQLSVLLVDDHELIRQGLAGSFERAGGFTVAGQAGTVTEALEVARACIPDVVVTDLRLPDGSGLEVVRALRAERPELAIVVLTMHAGDEQIFAAMDAGASAFVGKHAPSGEVIAAAQQAVTIPGTFVCADLAEAMVRRLTSTVPRLTEREREVLDLLADGLGNLGIAERLFVSESTAKAHVARIYDKLGATNRAQALMSALRLGLIGNDVPR